MGKPMALFCGILRDQGKAMLPDFPALKTEILKITLAKLRHRIDILPRNPHKESHLNIKRAASSIVLLATSFYSRRCEAH